MNEKIQMIIVLLSVAAVSGASLSYVYQLTKPIIEGNRQQELVQALESVLPEAKNYQEIDIDKGNTNIIRSFKATRNEDIIGYAFVLRFSGFQGDISIVMGTSNEEITKIQVLDHLETPGLGSRITESSFLSQFQNSDLESKNYDAITGATISSSAMIEAVELAQEQILDLLRQEKLK
jgi:electron transport complex protein RnfG